METEDSARYAMFQQLAQLVGGDFRLEKPLYFKHGETAQNRLGDTVIRVDPTLSPENFYTVFLHELAHVWLRHNESGKSLSDKSQIEHDAQLLAGVWAKMALGRHDKRSIEMRLVRLLYHFRKSVKRR